MESKENRNLRQRIAPAQREGTALDWEREATLAPEVYQCRKDYLRAMSLARNKLHRMKGEFWPWRKTAGRRERIFPISSS